MKPNIFTATPNWTFTQADLEAQTKLSALQEQERKSLPQDFYHLRTLTHLNHIKQSPLYPLLHSIPKGVMQHTHYICNDDQQFYRKYVLTDHRVFLNKDLTDFHFGTKQEAAQDGWVSMKQGIEKEGEEPWLKRVFALVSLSQEWQKTVDFKQTDTWKVFQGKILCPIQLFNVRHIFEHYTRHFLLKFANNGYDRIEVRGTLQHLNEYDQEGNITVKHGPSTTRKIIDEIVSEIQKTHPNFTVGFICSGFKMWNDEMAYNVFKEICDSGWDKLVGFDFVQEEDKYPTLQQYDIVVDRILKEYPHLSHLKKAYHAGQTVNHRTHNVDLAVKAGSVRIGHGLNILQRVEFLPHCRNVCFEKNPISNMLLGYKDDLRQASAPILLGLGYPVTISPDDPGKFGYEDCTVDYFASLLAYNWTLRHLKLIALHSINHALCQTTQRTALLRSFNQSWNKWVQSLLKQQDKQVQKQSCDLSHSYHTQDLFNDVPGWSFSQNESAKSKDFDRLRQLSLSKLPEGRVFQIQKEILSSPISKFIETLPKGVLLGSHFYGFCDKEFINNILSELSLQQIFYSQQSKNLSRTRVKDDQSYCTLYSLMNEAPSRLKEILGETVSIDAETLRTISGNSEEFWKVVSSKLSNIQCLLLNPRTYRHYVHHVLSKLIRVGYLRAELRIHPVVLSANAYSPYSEFIQIIREEVASVQRQYPEFSLGLVILGDKSLPFYLNRRMFQLMATHDSSLIVGVDFWHQDEDNYASLVQYDALVDQILEQYPDLRWAKLYQAGNSSSHKNNNIKIALKGGATRIASPNNILQHTQILPLCRRTCLELSPLLALVEGATKRDDLRMSITSTVTGLGLPVTITPQLGSIFGLSDPEIQLTCTALACNFSLKHLKMLSLYSVNHTAVTAGHRAHLVRRLEAEWSRWANQ